MNFHNNPTWRFCNDSQ